MTSITKEAVSKLCNMCFKGKGISEFRVRENGKRRNTCILCAREALREYRRVNKVVLSAASRERYLQGRPRDTKIYKKHGMYLTRVYRCWTHMKTRCNNPKDKSYKDYGARGIKVCERWLDFQNFWEDVKNEYRDDLTIERKDFNGNYEPKNVTWIPMSEQGKNTRAVRFYTHNGETLSIAGWARKTGVNHGKICQRLGVGHSFEEATSKAPLLGRRRLYEINGETHCLAEWAKITGLGRGTINSRILMGWDVKRAITHKVQPINERNRNKDGVFI